MSEWGRSATDLTRADVRRRCRLGRLVAGDGGWQYYDMDDVAMTMTDRKQAADLRVRDLVLDALSVSSGAVDAISFLALGRVFSAFMTGNIAFLGFRVAGADGPDAVAIVVAMTAFAVGVYLSMRIVERSEGAGIWPQRVTVALSVALTAHALCTAVWIANHGRPSGVVAHFLLGAWGFAMGIQSAAVRTLHAEGVLTTAATSTVMYLVEDITHRRATGPERWRRASVLVSLFIGATGGALLLVHARLYAPLLPLLVTFVAVAIALVVLRKHDTGGAQEPAKSG